MLTRSLVKAVALTGGATILFGTVAAGRGLPTLLPGATHDLGAPAAASTPKPATPAAAEAGKPRDTGEAPESDDDASSPEARARRIASVATATGLTEAQVQALLSQGLGFGELDHAVALSQATGGKLSVDAIVAMKTGGMGWGQIAHQLGVHPGVLGHGLKGARGKGPHPAAVTRTPPSK